MTPSSLQFGPYKTERVLGRGGMGVVYAAVDVNTGQPAAVKVLTTSLAGDLRLRERFSGEIEALKLLKHPRIVELFGYGEQEGRLFYAMERVEGRSLQDELNDGRRITWLEAARFGVDVCEALRHAHDHGVVHRDLKPANLLLDPTGHIKLSDFGIAKLFGGSQLTAAGGVLGTADYMSPEQAEGRPATPRSDLYSLGSVLYALLARRAPFESKTLPEVIHRLIHEAPQPIGRLVPDLPQELENVIDQLLSKDPDQRIPTALALGKRLQALVDEHAPPLAPLDDEPLLGNEDVLDEEHASPSAGTRLDTERGTSPTMAYTPAPPAASEGELALAPVEVHLKPTIVRPDSPEPAAVPSRPTTRFTNVDKKSGRRGDSVDEDSHDRFLWLKLAGMGLVLALMAAGVAYAVWPPSANTLYGQISQAAASGEPANLVEVESQIGRFLTRFATDERATEVAAWKEDLDRHRLRRRLERQTRQLGDSKTTSPLERLYLDALRDAKVSPEQAAARLEALVDLFGNDDSAAAETKRYVELAREELKSLQAVIATASKDQMALLTARLDRADELVASDPAAAQAIWRGMILLYSDKPWAADLVARARKNLAEHAVTKATLPSNSA